MTYRVRRSTCGEVVVFHLSGTLDSDVTIGLERMLADEPPRGVRLDLQDVTLVMHEAIAFLARAESAGTALVHCPDYVRRWMAAQDTDTR